MIKFNMNNYVWFEPTELGEKVYNDYFTQLGFEEPHNKLKIVEGKAKLQFRDFMSIQELLQAAKDIEVTSEQIARLRNLLEEQGKQENLKSSTSSNELLSRTYSL